MPKAITNTHSYNRHNRQCKYKLTMEMQSYNSDAEARVENTDMTRCGLWRCLNDAQRRDRARGLARSAESRHLDNQVRPGAP